MNVQERHQRILSLLRTRDAVEIGELCKALDVSRETVRKDLYELEGDGLLTKVRGGAVLNAGKVESAYDLRKDTEARSKRAIVAEAVKLIEPGDTVFLDYGTTTYMLAEELASVDDITVVTNALPIANLLVTYPGITVMIPGGVVHTNENSLYGPLTDRNMRSMFMNIGFFGCAGVDLRAGITNHNMFENAISRLGIEHSQRVITLADHTKFGLIAENKTADLEGIDQLITDERAPIEVLDELKHRGVKTTIAPTGRN